MPSRLALLRGWAEMSARELDRLANRSQGLCAIIEARGHATITTETASAYAAVFGVPVGWLIAGEGPIPRATKVIAAAAAARETHQRKAG